MSLTPFAGRAALRQGGVLFIAAEGAQYVNERLQGVKQAKTPEDRAIEPAPFAWLTSCPALVGDEALAALTTIARAASQRLSERFGLAMALIVIDTVSAAAMFRDANDTSESQRVMSMLAKLAENMQVLVLCVDHFGKDVTTGTRNSSVKESSADSVLALLGDRTPAGVVSNARMTIRKHRGGETGVEILFRPRLIELDGGGGMLVIDWAAEAEAPNTAQARQGWPKKLHTLKAALSEMIGSCRFDAFPFLDGPKVRVVKRELVRIEFAKRWPGEPSALRQAFSSKVKDAIAEGFMQSREITLSDGAKEQVFWPLKPW
jgi:hypothetical protein